MTSLFTIRSIASVTVRGAAALALVSLLVSCGGGGPDAGVSPFPAQARNPATPPGLNSSDTYAQRCVAPRADTTIDPFTNQPYGDVQGTSLDEKNFLRAFIDETYLWYRDVRGLSSAVLDPAGYPTPQAYFGALKSPLRTASGAEKDQFHFTYETNAWIDLSLRGESIGYGFELSYFSTTVPRRVVVAYTNPGTSAAMQGVIRGDEIVSIDGVDFVSGNDVAVLNAGLFPSAPGNHTFVFRAVGGGLKSVVLAAASVTSRPVQNVMTLPAPNANVGYMLFNDHIATSEAQLVAAINTLKAAGITDLVLDLRYNGGGYLDIAAELAYMIAGPTQTAGKFFERLTYNDRNPFNQSTAQATTDFHSRSRGFSPSLPSGTALPYLGLSRVYVLTSADTCSASEAIINGLRGAGVTVETIGATTCGKPYGFYPRDNCGTTYFAIQFQGVNNLGFGDYADGFAPTCPVADDFSKALGDPAENQLEVALGLRNTSKCTLPIAGKQKQQATTATTKSSPTLIRNPARENRIYR